MAGEGGQGSQLLCRFHGELYGHCLDMGLLEFQGVLPECGRDIYG
ncbi:uncharacterized protein G2W53_017098 [Senna tora]|uniref:Uncharacterized protein n=1 Tax=Senna tora TaxID=362788 RepID=A0A834WQP3_9FABA|nr:uncharacterized protein G2W53_017098 [Senna tora]